MGKKPGSKEFFNKSSGETDQGISERPRQKTFQTTPFFYNLTKVEICERISHANIVVIILQINVSQ